MLTNQAEAYDTETFMCGRCKREFDASVATWVDVSHSPIMRRQLQEGRFNRVTCPHCGNRQFSGTFFFYEDFADGLLIAVFPSIPANHQSLEPQILRQYGHYPVLEIFYDMTQLWVLIYLQDYYRKSASSHPVLNSVREESLRRYLRFIKSDPLMLNMREALSGIQGGFTTDENLQNLLWRVIAKFEGTSPVLPDPPAAGLQMEK